jgi:hypothetical protein
MIPAISLLALANFALLSGCGSEPHPTASECRSTEKAARAYYRAIAGEGAQNLVFRTDKSGKGLSGFKVYHASGTPVAAMIISESDCSLLLFDRLPIE